MSRSVINGSLLLVDDDLDHREMLEEYLVGEGYQCLSYGSGVEAFADLSSKGLDIGDLDLVISDISMPEMDGMEFLQRVHKLDREIPVILITAFSSIESAIEATRRNAFDYIVKPFKLSHVASSVERAVHFRRLKKENSILKEQVKGSWSYGEIIGKSKAMQTVFDLIEKVSTATANVLITGESGTGKEVVAKAIHKNGPRCDQPFVAINCTSIPENLLESELFGHLKGSFTGAIQDKIGLFQEANGGSIFLDEIGDLDLSLQGKILRVLQERKVKPVGGNKDVDVNVRVLAATHKDLKKAIKEGRFREDLYYRLSVIPILIPPLRERRDDIPLLANHFIKKYAAANGSIVKGFTPQAMDKLIQCNWTGNVRELENIVERVIVLCNKDWINENDIPTTETTNAEGFFSHAISDWPTIDQLEKRYIETVLEKTGSRKEKAAQILGINRRTLYRKEQEWGWSAGPEETDNDSH